MSSFINVKPTPPETKPTGPSFVKLNFWRRVVQPKVYVPVLIIVLIATLVGSMLVQYSKQAKEDAANGVNKGFGATFVNKLRAEKTAVSGLDGLRYPEAIANRHALGVTIENHPNSRPQFGLSDASVVYEAQAEGGITRFLAIFGPKVPEKVGPVRSARTYYLDWCLEYDCFYAHVGGNIDALDIIPGLKIKDLDQFRYGTKAYARAPRQGIATEHTMYANTTKLYGLAASNKWPATDSYPSVQFKSDESVNMRGAAQTVAIEISSKQYNTSWVYDPNANSYTRFMGGTPHTDGKTGVVIKSKVVIVQEVPTQAIVTRINEQGLKMTTVGSGKAQLFQDGIVTLGSWEKASQKAPTIFYNETGDEVKYNAGQRWITIVSPGSKVSVTQNTGTASPTPQ